MCCALSNFPWNKKKESLFNYELMYATRLASQKSNRTTLQSRPALEIRHWVECFLSGGRSLSLVCHQGQISQCQRDQ